MCKARPVSHLVVVGSSAGGINALSVLLSSLPQEFPGPIVIAQHLDPDRPSRLDQVLRRRSKLPVRMVKDREPLRAGTVYVVPAHWHVSISDQEIALRRGGEGRPQPSIDLLLTSAAESFGDRLIAIILTGSGSDGASGARVVHEAGGVVIIQNPEGASYPAMPRSLAPSTVDLVADLENIGSLLTDLLAGDEAAARPDERRQVEAFLEGIRERYGMDFSTYKLPTIRRRLQRRIVATGSRDLAEYTRYLDEHPEEYPKLLDSFLIKVTQFFRDPELFEYLRAQVLPEIIQRARVHNKDIRIWSAGCATGEEAYSLAILLAEALGEELDLFDVRIFATDADPEAVAYAREGAYPARALASVPDDIVARYFTQDSGTYHVRKRVRSMVVFGEHDLARRAPFPRIDMVMCRNVLIYFTPELQRHVLRSFAYSLRDRGALVLGKAESVSPLPDYFEMQEPSLKVYRRRGEHILAPPAPMTSPAGAGISRSRPYEWMDSRTRASRPWSARPQTPGLASNSFLLSLPVGVVVVNQSYDIQAINSAARRLLSIHSPAIGEDLIHTARKLPYAEIRSAIDSAFHDGTRTIIAELPVDDVTATEPGYYKITCYPQGEQRPAELVTVLIDDISEVARERHVLRRQLEEINAERERAEENARRLRERAEAEVARRQEQIERLVRTNQEITEANQELTRLNEELRSRNEELMLMTEEAQAATEEVETLNEELQASNEELETLNEEMQATVEELNTTNEDLEARSRDLQELSRASEGERLRLEAMLSSMADAVLVVDRSGNVVLSNEAFARAFGEPRDGATELGGVVLRDEEGRELPADRTPQHLASCGESFKMEFTTVAEDGSRRFYEATGAPIGREGEIEGGVVVVRDITDRSLRRLQEEFLALAGHELRNHLAALQSYLELLIRGIDKNPEDTDTLRRRANSALGQTRRLGRLVSDLVDVARLQTGGYNLEMEPLQLHEIVARAVEVAQPLAESQTIHLEAEEGLTVRADAHRLQQVVMNLLQNAITHAPNTEHIDVRVRRSDGWAQIEVRDYGPGIPAEELPNLFTRFYRVRGSDRPPTRGLGLGLYISRQIAEAHGGTIKVSSEVGQGATFRVLLPLLEG